MPKRHPSLVPLSHDHHHGLALALRCRKHALGQLNPGDQASLEDCAAEVVQFFEAALLPHFEAEEKVLFMLLSGHDQCRSLVVARQDREPTSLPFFLLALHCCGVRLDHNFTFHYDIICHSDSPFQTNYRRLCYQP